MGIHRVRKGAPLLARCSSDATVADEGVSSVSVCGSLRICRSNFTESERATNWHHIVFVCVPDVNN